MGSVPPMQVLEVGANLSAHIARPPILRTDQALLVAACRSSSFLEASLNLGWSQHAPCKASGGVGRRQWQQTPNLKGCPFCEGAGGCTHVGDSSADCPNCGVNRPVVSTERPKRVTSRKTFSATSSFEP